MFGYKQKFLYLETKHHYMFPNMETFYYICILKKYIMVKYDLELTEEAVEFITGCDIATQKKILKTLDKVKQGFFGSYYSKMSGTDGLYECRVDTKDHWLRLLTKHYKSDDGTIVIVLHGFKKKENKIPPKEIRKAEKIYERLARE